MIIVRIGNNIHVLWKIYNNTGSKYSLSGKVRRLWLSSAALEKEIDTYQIQYRNELVFTIDAGDLTRYGTYKLVLQLSESDSQTEDATYDLTQLFQIVARTYPGACKELDGEVDVQVTSVLNNVVVERIEGLSAYEIAVNEGYVGTESEWIESLNGVGIASIDQTVIAVDDGSYNEVTFTMTNGETYTIRIRNGSKSAAVTRDDIIFALGYTPVTPAELAAKTDIFFAKYNSTTWQEINEAVNAGKAVFLNKDEDIYPLVGDGGVTPKLWEFAFVDTGLDHHRAVCHNDDTWQSTTRGLATVIDLASKQDVISDLAAIRAGAALGSTAYQKPSTGIPASDMASGVIPDISGKQDTLVSGSNIKTINGSSILGSGNIEVQTSITTDSTPTSGSTNPVESGGVYTALQGKQTSISTVNVSVDSNTGTPSATASVAGDTMSISFSNLKGGKGDTGATPEFSVGTVSTLPEGSQATVSITGTTDSPVLNIGIPTGATGAQGNTGSSVDYPYELVNNVTTNDATKGLSAAQGVVLDEKISQLGLKISEEEYASMQTFDESKIYFVYAAENYNITNSLTNCSSNNSAVTARELSSYVATLSANSGYKLSSVSVLMGGMNVTSLYYSNGVINIPSVTGNIEISATAVALAQFTITNNLSNATNSNSATSIYEENAYSATLTALQGYYISEVVITMGGVDVTSSVYSNGAVNIPSVTGNIVITVATTSVPSYSVTNSLTNCSTNNDATYANEGSPYTARLSASSGYAITTINITMGGVDITNSAYNEGLINIASVTGNIIITAVATAPVINITDSAAKTILVNNFDTNSDGEIDTMEAAAVTTLGTLFKSNTNIQDISWLSYFSGLTTMVGGAFQGCTGVTSLNITSSAPITNFNDCFRGMTGLTGTAKYANSVTTHDRIASMFYGCNNLTGIDLSGLNMTNCASIIYAFNGCTKLTTLNISGWNLSKMKKAIDDGFAILNIYGNAFKNCSALTSVIMNGCNSDTLTVIELALVNANIASNVTISVDGVDHTYDGTNWN